jgi:N6-adenosine-specific RNA methylase IME4
MTESSSQQPSRSILYRNESNTITILDGPQSILEAQGSSPEAPNRVLLSCDPQTEPHTSCEPRTAKGRRKLIADQEKDVEYHSHVVELATKALEDLKRSYQGEWHLPRQVHRDGEARNDPELSLGDSSPLYGKRISNDADEPSSFVAFSDGQDLNVTMPSHSSFILGDVQEICQLNLHLPPGTLKQPSFKLILMDPPWPNASAKRRSAYKRSANLTNIKHMLLDIPVPEMLDRTGVIGIWITNRPSFRDLVLGEDGLFEQWGVQLYEEWIWVKTTENGEPVVALDSLWRKPYEIFLLGKRDTSTHEPRARVILGVPDIHSRKPCLKSMWDYPLKDMY